MYRRDQFFDLNITAEDILDAPINTFPNIGLVSLRETTKIILNEDGSDFAGDNTTSGFIVVSGDSVTGQISSGTDVDWIFLDNPNAASLLNLSFITDSALGMEINLIGIDGLGEGDEVYNLNLITDIVGDFNFELPDTNADIVWFFELVATEDFAHDYTLTLTQAGSGSDDFAGDSSTTGTLSPGISTTTGIIESVDDHDWFAFSATEGQVIDFAVLRPGTDATNYELDFVIRDANGDIVPVFDYTPLALDNEVTFIAEASGTYYLDVTASSGWSDQTAQTVDGYGHYEIFPILSGLPSSLATAFQVGYQPWALLPNTGDRPTVDARTDGAFFVENDLVIESGEIYFWGLESNDAALTGISADAVDTTVTNRGLIYVEDLFGFVENDNFPITDGSWAFAVAGGNSSLFRNEGEVVAISSLYNAAGFFDITGFTTFENIGSLQAVSAYGSATGVSLIENDASHFNSGTIEAWGGDTAIGISLDNGGNFDNSGIIAVDGFNGAVGMFLDNFTSSIINSGTLVSNTFQNDSIGVFAFADNGAGGSNTYQITIENTGLIQADSAVVIFQDADPNMIGPNEEFTQIFNTGTIIGNIFLDSGYDLIENSNVIDGSIFMGAGVDEYLGQNGTVSGLIDLGSGDDTAIGGAGSETFIGGLGNDIMDGGDGIDYAVFNVSAFSDLTIVENADGSFTVTANTGSDGTDTLRNIEFIRIGNEDFELSPSDPDVINGTDSADTLTGTSGNDTLIGGLGNDTLSGGSGADKFVFALGDGQDVITDFDASEDIIELALSPYMSMAQLRAMLSQHDGYVMMDMGGGDAVRFDGMTVSDFTVDNFILTGISEDGAGPFRDPNDLRKDLIDTSSSGDKKNPPVMEVFDTGVDGLALGAAIEALNANAVSPDDVLTPDGNFDIYYGLYADSLYEMA